MTHRAFVAPMVALALARAAQPVGIERVSWTQGCWTRVSSGRPVEEQWMAPRGGSMVDMSRTVAGSRLSEYELIVIREDGGSLVCAAHPSGQAGASFRSTEASGHRAVFENRLHDFPQRTG